MGFYSYRLTQSVKLLTRLATLATRVLSDGPYGEGGGVATGLLQMPPTYTTPAWVTPPAPPAAGVAGYFGGGFNQATGAVLNGIDKITFPGDTLTTLSPTLSAPNYTLAGMANSGVAGYFGGGQDFAGRFATVDKITFPGDTKTTLGAVLTAPNSTLAAMANSGVAGYFGGGNDFDGSVSLIDKITFSSDAKTTLAATISGNRSDLTGMANSGVAGYFGGGFFLSNVIDKITFPGDTKTTLGAVLTEGRRALAAMANDGVAGYFGGGTSDTVGILEKLNFSTETLSVISAVTLSRARNQSAMADPNIAGYFGGGYTSPDPSWGGIDKITFSSDAKTTLAATLVSAGFYSSGAMANGS